MYKNRIVAFILGIVLIGSMTVTATEIPAEYRPACGFVRVTTNLMGYNILTKQIAKTAIKKSLNQSIKGDYSVTIDSFSGVDLKKGKFRGLTIEGKDLCMDESVYFSRLYMKTTSDFNYVDYRKKPVEFKTDIPMEYIVEINEDDLNKSVRDDNALNTLTSLIPLVRVDKFTFKIEENKIRMSTAIHIPFTKAIKFSVSGSPQIVDGKIVMTNIETTSSKREITDKITSMMNNYNLLENIKLHLFDGTTTKMAVKNVKVSDKKIHIDGTVVIKKV